MRKILWAWTLLALVGLSVPAGAAEPKKGILKRGRDIVQAAFHGHDEPEADRGPALAPAVDDDAARIGQLITILQSDPKAHRRRWAADELDEYRWEDHPEIVTALVGAMQSDSDPWVRKKAADSLKDMKASAPEVLAAMQFSAGNDNNKWVRWEARSAAHKLQHDQPPVLSYVSGYGPSTAKEPSPKTQPAIDFAPADPGPEPIPMPMPNDKPAQAKRGPVRSAISTAVTKLRPRS